MKKVVIPALAGGVFLTAAGQSAMAAGNQAVVSLADRYQGTPYSYGARSYSTAAFDCSSFTQYIYKKAAGITLPRTSAAQATVGTAVAKANLQAGDLLFFDTDGNGSVNHVGIYIGGGRMISAELTVGVHITNVFAGGGSQYYWQKYFVGARRVIGASSGGEATQSTSQSSTTVRASASQTSYTVKSGDSLWAIARGHGLSVAKLKSLNDLNSNTIYPGQKLALSGNAGSQVKVTSAVSSAARKTGGSASSYTIKSGDSLWAIARGHGLSVAKLKSLNGLKSNLIYPGQKLTLSGAQASNQTEQKSSKTGADTNGYTVKSGDNLWSIATMHGITVNKLMRTNNLSSILIFPGQKLVIPG
ncbi:MAG: LysM peptidoglycan-binding domain-containing protein [Sporolactobacillus sp.]|jgi:LysM repeat protein|nr:LysM peptidoglycan-binding domain-containing protein [Sporolactobacillus sp.]